MRSCVVWLGGVLLAGGGGFKQYQDSMYVEGGICRVLEIGRKNKNAFPEG